MHERSSWHRWGSKAEGEVSRERNTSDSNSSRLGPWSLARVCSRSPWPPCPPVTRAVLMNREAR